MNVTIKYFIIVLVINAMSCKRTCPCSPAAMPINLVAFSKPEVDTIIVRQFIKGTNFQNLKDTVLVDSTNQFDIELGGDTIQLATSSSLGKITSQFDYEVYIPAIHKISRISGVREQQKDGPCGRCVNFIITYNKDGQIYNFAQLYITR